MRLLDSMKEAFLLSPTINRIKQDSDAVLNYGSYLADEFFEMEQGGISTVVSGGTDDVRGKMVDAFVSTCISSGLPVVVFHQGNMDRGYSIFNKFNGVVNTNEIGMNMPCYDPFFELDGNGIAELILYAAPKSYRIDHNVKYYIEGIVEILRKSRKKPYFNLLATCPHHSLFDRVDRMISKGDISDVEGQELKSKLMIGQSEGYKLESYLAAAKRQMQPFVYRTRSPYSVVNIQKAIREDRLLIIDIGNVSNELYINLLLAELKNSMAYGNRIGLVMDSISLVGNEMLKGMIKSLSDQIVFMMVGEDVISLTGADEQLFTTLVGRSKRIVVFCHNMSTSAVKWSKVFGEYDKQEQSYSISKGRTYNSPLSFMATSNYNRQVNYNWKREYVIKPEMITSLKQGEAYIYSSKTGGPARITLG